MAETQRSRDIARAALLRERIIGAIKGSTSGMTAKQLCDWTSIAELYHGDMLPGKVQAQVKQLLKQGVVDKAGSKPNTTYFIKRKREAEQPVEQPDAVKHLQLEVSKSQHTVSFVFEGLQITVKVLP